MKYIIFLTKNIVNKEFFHRIFLDNTIQNWLISFAIIVFALVFSKALSKLLASLCVKIFTKIKHKNYSEIFTQNIVHPLSRYILWTLILIALERLDFPKDVEFRLFKSPSKEPLYFSDVALAISRGWLTICFFRLVIGVEIFVASIIKDSAIKRNDRSTLQMISLLADLTKAILIVICVLCILKFSFNYSLSSFVTSLGLVTAALALAAKESVENIISSFVIFLDKPFYVGDTISVNGFSGTVEKIGLRSTLLRTDAKTLVSMSNSSVISGALENTSNQLYRRCTQTLELDLDTKPEAIEKLCNTILDLLKNKSDKNIVMPTVYFKETGVNSHKIYMQYFGAMNLSLDEFHNMIQEINLEIVGAVQQEGIVIIRMGYR